jgi:hypothetical protein
VGVAALHLVADARSDIAKGESTGFLCDAAVEHDLEQEIAQLVLEIADVATGDRVGDFVGFLDRVRRDCRPGLRSIPVTSIRSAQPCHDREQPLGHRERPLR